MGIILQVINDAQLANWVIAVILVILGALLVRILNRIEKTQEDHGERLGVVETKVAIIDDRKDKSKETLDNILSKLEQIKAMQ